MSDDTVIFSKTINGTQYDVTVSMIENHPKRDDIYSHAVHRILNAARTNAEDKDAAEEARILNFINQTEWRSGGGNAISEATRLYRGHLAAWAATHASYGRSEADSLARKDASKLLSETAKAILRKKGEQTGKDRVAKAAENLHHRIQSDVNAALGIDADAIDI